MLSPAIEREPVGIACTAQACCYLRWRAPALTGFHELLPPGEKGYESLCETHRPARNAMNPYAKLIARQKSYESRCETQRLAANAMIPHEKRIVQRQMERIPMRKTAWAGLPGYLAPPALARGGGHSPNC